MLLGQVYGELPFMIIPLYVSLEKLDAALLEAAADCGAGPVRTFSRVVVPQTMPGIVAGCVLVFIPSLGAYLAPDLLGGGKTAYVGNLIQSQFAVARDMPFGAALSFLLSLLVVLLLLAFRTPLRSPSRCEASDDGQGDAGCRWPASAVLVYAFLYAPIVVLVALSFNASRLSASWEGFTLAWYAKSATNPAILSSLRNSLLVGVVGTPLIATALRHGGRAGVPPPPLPPRGPASNAAMLVPTVAPEIVLAASLLLLFAAAGLRLGFVDRRSSPTSRSRSPTRSWS